jgi:hypothetical protein
MTTIFDVADSHLFSSSLAKSALVVARKYEPGDCYSVTCICWEALGSDFGPEDTLTRFFLIYLQSLYQDSIPVFFLSYPFQCTIYYYPPTKEEYDVQSCLLGYTAM